MHAYQAVLFVHLLALLVATGAAVLAFFAALQMREARAPSDVASWGKVVKAVVPCFPVAALVLAGSGAYLTLSQWRWTTPWIDAGMAGLVLIVLCGNGVEGPRGRALVREVRAAGLSPRARALLRDPLAWSAKLTTLTLMVAIVFLMSAKPSAVGSALTLVLAMVLGPLLAVPFWRWPPRNSAPTPGPGASAPNARPPLDGAATASAATSRLDE